LRLVDLPWVLAAGLFVLACIWAVAAEDVVLANLLGQALPAGTAEAMEGVWLSGWRWPTDEAAHAAAVVVPVSLVAIGTAFVGFMLATLMYGLGRLSPREVRRQFEPIYRFLLNKWWFDELYDWLFVRPTHLVASWAARLDKRWIDGFIDGAAVVTGAFSRVWDRVADRSIVDGFFNLVARWAFAVGLSLRVVQTGSLRQYVVFLVIAAVAIFILISFFWNPTLAG
jgi:NADH-quinone oxidoreductase subunit L